MISFVLNSAVYRSLLTAVLLFVVCVPGIWANDIVDNTLQPKGTVIVPDTFLRRWDPVTIFFNRSVGEKGKAEHEPEKYLSVSPQHPGAYTWLDDSTLQFRPAEPWPPLSTFNWQVGRKNLRLTTLVSAPTGSVPAAGSRDLNGLDAITLTFPSPVDPLVLKQMLSIELRPLPGIDSDDAQWLRSSDFEIKVIERSSSSEAASYVVNLNNPIANGTLVKVHLRLSLNDDLEQSFHQIELATAEPFSIKQVGCTNQLYPIAAKGSEYPGSQAIQCASNNRQLQVHFSSRLAEVNPLAARNLIHITPAVDNLSYRAYGNILAVDGDFQTEQLYRINLEAADIRDVNQRFWNGRQNSELFLYFPLQPSYLRWEVAAGVMETEGPKMLPLVGQGFERIDLRIHPIDPLDRSFWPFPDSPIVTNDEQRPEAPGEEPETYSNKSNYISQGELRRQIKALGAPTLSKLVDVPLQRAGRAASFGLDLAPHLNVINGRDKPGTYLVGMRKLNDSNERHWVRIQVTDLALTTINEPERVQFVVTSLSDGDPVPGATIEIEGAKDTIFTTTTNRQGQSTWQLPERYDDNVRRIVVRKGDDVLVLDPTRAPQTYANNLWYDDYQTWLQWTRYRSRSYDDSGVNQCHIFTERPVYKPDQPVHIKGYARNIRRGVIDLASLGNTSVVVDGPGDLEWRYPVILTSDGSFYWEFAEEGLPTGRYLASLESNRGRCGLVSFRKEAYRLPTFEVQIEGPKTVGLDAPFELSLDAQYYAGGQVQQRPVQWRVTQFPYTWSPQLKQKREGFFFSSSARYSGQGPFEASGLLVNEGETDELGRATVRIDPTIETTAQARRYVVEATVTGADDQTVTSTYETRALPPFVLGLKVPRYTQSLHNINAEILVADFKGELLAGQKVAVRMQQRQWHSHLQLGDYSKGVAKYVTEVVDELVYETEFDSLAEVRSLPLPIDQAGVYIVDISAQDKLGRTQTVSVDLFAGGEQPVAWSRQPTQVFKVTTDKDQYDPGETAKFILESPFQSARALAIVEQPDGRSRYEWLNVRNGQGRFELEVEKAYLPRLPVHFLLLRGRVGETSGNLDLGKPQTLAATAMVEVKPTAHRIKTELSFPKTVQPGDEIELEINLTDNRGNPVAGEVTLWLVDQSVLALGTEQATDPLPDFIRNRDNHTRLRDTRNSVLGFFPYQEQPGGDGFESSGRAQDLLDKVTVRKNFSPVPYFNPRILVDGSGRQTVRIQIPDNLTNFKVRAKVVSGSDRFGFYRGELSVRLPVIVQPSLPRFVRPGDEFTGLAIGRIVEGEGGAGRSQIAVEGLTLVNGEQQTFAWQKNKPTRIEFPLQVPTPTYTEDGQLEREAVSVTVAVERSDDNARDAFQVSLPIKPDRKAVKFQRLYELDPNEPLVIDGIEEPVRPGTLRRTLSISNQAALLRMSSGLNYLLSYPHGCTEQRLSRARAQLASVRFSQLLSRSSDGGLGDKSVRDTLEWLGQVINADGLVSYWPGSQAYVSLSAWTLMFFVEARAAGVAVDQAQWDLLVSALRRSLRSDYRQFITGESYSERVLALLALTKAGEDTSAFAAELVRRADYSSIESVAQIITALQSSQNVSDRQLSSLYDEMWRGLVFRLFQGREIYGGLQRAASARNALILPSETRTIAEVLRAASLTPETIRSQLPVDRQQQMLDALVTLGKGDGWGTTNANAAALLSLTEVFTQQDNAGIGRQVDVNLGNQNQRINFETPLQTMNTDNAESLTLQQINQGVDAGQLQAAKPIAVLVDTQYWPASDGSQVAALANGFVVRRELLKIVADAPPIRLPLQEAGLNIEFVRGDVVEDHVEIVNPTDAAHVAIVVPLAAGMEPLNPNLATSPPEAKPSGTLTQSPSYALYGDDQVAFYYDSLPAGTYHFYFRARANVVGRFIQPAAYAEQMYNEAINGNSAGAKIIIAPPAETADVTAP